MTSATGVLADPASPVGAQELQRVPAPESDISLTIIEPRRAWQLIDLPELWRYRELLFFLAWRDVKVRYKQTALGAAWAVLQPLATMLVFSAFLGRVAGVASSIEHYGLFVFAAMLPWSFFANSITSASTSIVGNYNLVTKVYFPRLIIPTGAVVASLVDFAVAFVMLVAMMLWNGILPAGSFWLAPLALFLLVLAALGVGLLLAALTVAFRDFRYIVTFGIQLWMFATPCIYLSTDAIGPRGQLLLPLNPAYGLLLNFRQAMLGGAVDWYSLTLSGGVSVAAFFAGCLYFRRVESSFADII